MGRVVAIGWVVGATRVTVRFAHPTKLDTVTIARMVPRVRFMEPSRGGRDFADGGAADCEAASGSRPRARTRHCPIVAPSAPRLLPGFAALLEGDLARGDEE